MNTATLPELYWISGSPPSWRVMLGLTLKGMRYTSRRLDHGAGENRSSAYLALNPKGQVPTLRDGKVVVRESIAILAYLDRARPERPIFGTTPAEAAAIWQQVMLFENDLRPAITMLAQSYLRGTVADRLDAVRAATDAFLGDLDRIETCLATDGWICGAAPNAADCWLFPSLGWIDRALARTAEPVAPRLASYLSDRPALARWRDRFGALPGIAETYPPHWAARTRDDP